MQAHGASLPRLPNLASRAVVEGRPLGILGESSQGSHAPRSASASWRALHAARARNGETARTGACTSSGGPRSGTTSIRYVRGHARAGEHVAARRAAVHLLRG
jgi:hypothetical protein